jgi:sigma-B regulation protein RsbU (phosphoserine phosphatase)
MGVLPDAAMELADPIELAPGDLFILLTDGFLEWARPDGQQYGQERLVELVRKHCDQSCPDLIQTIYQDVLRFADGSSQLDDLTAILIRRTGRPGRAGSRT